MSEQLAIKETVQYTDSSVFSKETDNWDVLPCEGIFKLTSKKENITFTYCRAAYQGCPNKSCIMQLV